jgi:hypothetical protein
MFYFDTLPVTSTSSKPTAQTISELSASHKLFCLAMMAEAHQLSMGCRTHL